MDPFEQEDKENMADGGPIPDRSWTEGQGRLRGPGTLRQPHRRIRAGRQSRGK